MDQYYCLLQLYAYTVVHEDKLKPKKKKRIFFTLLSLVAIQLGGRPPGYAYDPIAAQFYCTGTAL